MRKKKKKMRSGLGFSVVLGGRIWLGLWGSFKCQFLFLLLSSTPPHHHLFFNLGVCRQKGGVQMGSPAWESIDQGNGRLQVVIHYLINTQFIRRKKKGITHWSLQSKKYLGTNLIENQSLNQSCVSIVGVGAGWDVIWYLLFYVITGCCVWRRNITSWHI